MRVIMTGTREWRDAHKVDEALKAVIGFNENNEPLVVMHFATNVVDGMIHGICGLNGISVREVKPDWQAHGKAALYRLAENAVAGADLVVTFGNDPVIQHIATVGAANNVRVLNVEPAKAEFEVLNV